MRLFSLATVFCLVCEIKVIDGRPTQNSYPTFINRGSKHDGDIVTTGSENTATAERLDASMHPKVPFMMCDDSSKLVPSKYKLIDKRLRSTSTSLGNSQHSLISNGNSKQWDQLNVAVKRKTFLPSKLLDSIIRTNHLSYHRIPRNTNSLVSNDSIVVPNVNIASHQLDTVPGDIQTNGDATLLSGGNGDAPSNSGSPVSLSGGNGDTPSNSGSPVSLSGGNGDTPSNSGSPVLYRDGNTEISGAVYINTSGNIVTGSPLAVPISGPIHRYQNGSTLELPNLDGVNHNAPVNSEAADGGHQEPSPGGSSSGSEPGNTPEDNSHTGVLDHPVDVGHKGHVVVEPAGGVVHDNSSGGREHLNPNVDSNTNPSSNVSNEEVTSTDSIEVSRNGSASNSVEPSNHLNSNVTFSFPTQMSTVSDISRILHGDITPSVRNTLSSEVTGQKLVIQPTIAALPTLSTQDNTATFTSMQSASPPTTRPTSDEIGPGSTIIEQPQTSLPRRITASTLRPSIPSEKSVELIPQLQNINLTSTTPHGHVVAESPPTPHGHVVAESPPTPHGHVVAESSPSTPSTSRSLQVAGSVNGRAPSRDTPVVFPAHNTSGLLAGQTGEPPPIINNVPDIPELVHPGTTDGRVTEPIPLHPNTENNEEGEKVTEAPSSTSQETSEHQHNGGASSYATTVATLKPASSGNFTKNETDSPASYIVLKFGMSWRSFCQQEMAIRQELVDIIQVHVKSGGIAADQIQVMDRETVNCYQGQASDVTEILVRMYLTNVSHQFDRNLTLQCATILRSEIPFEERKNSIIKTRLLAINVFDKDGVQEDETTNDDNPGDGDGMASDTATDHRVTIAVALAVVGGCCCIGLIVLQVVVRRRHRGISPVPSISSSYSHRSSDSIQLASVIKSRPNSGLINPGLDILEPLEPSHPLNYMQLSNFCMDEMKIAEEYQKLPQRMPRLSMVPAGDEDKNRYANIVPLVHTRVKLIQDGTASRSSYINANYVTGPNNQCQYYIATQAPTENTTADFWTMIWQQGCQTIVMLTDMEEQGQIKSASYWPELVGKSAAHKYGDFLVELIQKDVHQEYIVSRLEINNQRKIENRQIDHFWYTCWPPHGLPEPISLVKLVLDVRPKYENGTSPLVVHCSPGTGRTCTFIALDLCMKQFETTRIVDVMKTVNSIRQERAGAIQNKEQYALLYNAIHEYAAIITTPGISATSSAATLQALLSS